MRAGRARGAAGRLVLLELVSPERFKTFRSELFPFYAGAAERLGLPCRWLRLPVEDADRSPDNRLVLALAAGKRKLLAAALRTFRATRLIHNEKLSDEACAELGRAFPGLRRHSAAEDARLDRLGAFEAFLSGASSRRPRGGAGLLDEAEPRYEPEWLARPKAAEAPLVNVLCGPQCLYRPPVAANPLFGGLDLSKADVDRGCSFCDAAREEFPPARRPMLELALRQIDGALASRAWKGLRKAFLVDGKPVFHRLGAFLDAVARRRGGSDFFFSCRADEFLEQAPAIEAALPGWREAGHTFTVWNMGVENFSPAENLRLNKGLSAAQVLEAARVLKRLAAAFPGTFAHNSFGCIAFTPWTTLEDLRANIRAARELGGLGALFFSSRLQLLPGRPITLLARKDGLLARSFSSDRVDPGCVVCWDQRERPWRFRHPEVAVALRISARLWPMEGFPADDDLRAVRSFLESRRLRQEREMYGVLEEVVGYLAAHPRERSVRKVLEGLRP